MYRVLFLMVVLLGTLSCEKILNYGSPDFLFPEPQYTSLNFNTGQLAAVALGAPSTSSAGPGVAMVNGFDGPVDATITYDQKLLISQNYRVGIFNSIPTVDFANQNLVIGQPDFVSTNGPVMDEFSFGGIPWGTFYDGLHLWVADPNFNRVLMYEPFPTTFQPAAQLVLGQTSFNSTSGGCSASTMLFPIMVRISGGKLFVLENGNARLLIWNTIPTANGTPADVVVGQPDMTTCSGMTAANRLNGPEGFWTNGQKLVISDTLNNRVLIWNSIPTTNGANADIVLGQNDFVSNGFGSNNINLHFPSGVVSNGSQLFVSDSSNNRVVIWNTFPTFSVMPIDVVLGQSNTSNNTSGSTSAKFNGPSGLALNSDSLIVVDSGNNRVMIYDSN